MTNLLKLHSQDLNDVMVELDRTKSPNAQILHDLAERGSVYSLNEKELGPLRKQGKVFQRNEWASPILTDQLPLRNPPNARQIKSILSNEMGGENLYHFVPSRGTPELDARVIVGLLNDIGTPIYNTSGAILNMQSPTFERLCQYKVDWPDDGILGLSQITMAVTPADDVQDMKYCEHYTLSTLLCGSKVWLAYPPLAENLAALQAHYQLLATGDYALAMSNAQNFKHGILIVQQAGQMAVSATYHAATATAFAQRIQHLSNFRLTVQLGLTDKMQDQHRLITFATELLDHLQRILEDSFPHRKVGKVIIDVCREYETLRSGLRDVLHLVDDEAIARGLENKYRVAWLKFLEEKRKKSPACRLCNMRVQNMPVGGTPADRLRQHFIDFHGLRSERFVQPVVRV